MTKYLFVFVIWLPLITNAQFDDLKLDKGQVYFEKVFILDSGYNDSIECILTLNIPKIKDITDFSKTSDIITAKIKEANIDYRKYGGKWVNTATFLNHPFYGDISIVWKESRYRVTINNMYFNVAGFGVTKCSDLFTKNKGTEFVTTKNMITAGGYLDKYLTDLFQISANKKSDW